MNSPLEKIGYGLHNDQANPCRKVNSEAKAKISARKEKSHKTISTSKQKQIECCGSTIRIHNPQRSHQAQNIFKEKNRQVLLI